MGRFPLPWEQVRWRSLRVAVSDFRERGILPEAMVNYLALLGWGPSDGVEVRPLAEIVELLRLEDVNSSPAFFDLKKLESINGDHLRALTTDEFVARGEPFPTQPERSRPAVEALAVELQTRVRTLAEVEATVDFIWLDEPVVDEKAWQKALTGDDREAAMLDATMAAWETCPLEPEPLKAAMEAAALTAGYVNAEGGPQLSKAQAPVRVAVDMKDVPPHLLEERSFLDAEQLGDLHPRERPALRSQKEGRRLAVEHEEADRRRRDPTPRPQLVHHLVEALALEVLGDVVELRQLQLRDERHCRRTLPWFRR